MKKLYILLSLISTACFAQDPALFLYNWQLINLTINGTNYPPPSNSEVVSVPLSFGNEDITTLETNVCNTFFGNTVYTGFNQFSFDGTAITLILCNNPDNNAFEQLYFQNFFSFNPGDVYTYSIIYLGDSPTLIITSNDGNSAVYGNQQMATEDFTKNQFSIYPNPVSDVLNIEFQNAEAENSTIEICNNLGQICISKTIFENHQLDVSQLISGVYFIKIQNNNKMLSQKFIKM